MKKMVLAALAAGILTVSASASEIRGHYIESRNAEIYASHCFANSENGIRGDLAVMAWQIESGEVEGVSLDGLHVAAVIRASATLGDPFKNPLPTKSMLIVDEKASAEQRRALEAFAKKASDGLIDEVVKHEAAPFTLSFHGNLHARKASLAVGELVKLETRAITGADSLCHLDNIYYGPLVELDHAMPAFALVQQFHNTGLGVELNEYRRSSVYMGSFVVAEKAVSDD